MLDFILFRAINSLVGKSDLLDIAGIFAAVYLIFVLVFGIAMLSARRKNLFIFLLAVASGGLGFLISQAIGLVNFRPRPFAFLEGVQVLISKSSLSKSFPSDHATLAFAMAAALFFSGEKKWGATALVMAFFVALGRVYVGVHFPFDIAFGALLGVFSAFIVVRAWRFYKESASKK